MDFEDHRDVCCHNNLKYLQLQAMKCSGASAWSSCPKNRLDLDANTNCHRSLFTGLHSQNSTEQETTHQDKLRRTFTYNQALTHPHARSVLMLPCCQPAKWINPAGHTGPVNEMQQLWSPVLGSRSCSTGGRRAAPAPA